MNYYSCGFLQPLKNVELFFLEIYAKTGSRLWPTGYSLPSPAHKQCESQNTGHSVTYTVTLPISDDGSHIPLWVFSSQA